MIMKKRASETSTRGFSSFPQTPGASKEVEIKLDSNKTTFKGIIMPSKDKNTLTLKLDSGYNININKKRIKSQKILSNKKDSKKETLMTIPTNKRLSNISILQVGGTIVSKVDYSTGAVIAKMTPKEFLNLVPQLAGIANINYRKILDIMSEDMRFGHYNLIAKEVIKEMKKGVKGVIITHGTDTLAQTSAALSFILQGISIPVLLVGAQRSGDRGSSDSTLNLVCASHFISKSDFKGVGICMHKSMDDNTCFILDGTRARKMHTSRRDAFKPINSEPIAEVTEDGKINLLKEQENKKTFTPLFFKDNLKIGMLKSHNNLYPENISCFKDYKGLILEGTGLGHFPAKSYDKISNINQKIGEEIKKLSKKGCIIALSSQCIFGRVNMNVYTPQKELQEKGIISSGDMHPETAFIKLAWLLSNFPQKKAKEMFAQNLIGELSPRQELQEEFM